MGGLSFRSNCLTWSEVENMPGGKGPIELQEFLSRRLKSTGVKYLEEEIFVGV